MTGSCDDLPEWLAISENCKPIHGLKSDSVKTDHDDCFKMLDLIEYRKSKGYTIESLALKLKCGEKLIQNVESGFWDCKKLSQIFKIYGFYGGMVSLTLIESEMVETEDEESFSIGKRDARNRRRKFVKYIMLKFKQLSAMHGIKKAAKVILKELEGKERWNF